jgi:RNA-directed DNA polymerase
LSKSHLHKIADRGNLQEVWRQFYREHRHTLAGTDGVSVEDFRRREAENLHRLRADLLAGYRFSPLRARAFRKPNSEKHRIICIPTIADRLVQRAIANFLIDDNRDRLGLKNGVSIGFLRGEGGVFRAQENAKRKRNTLQWAYKSDISAFFDTIDRSLVISKTRQKLRVPSVMRLIEKMVSCEANAEDAFVRRKMELAGIVPGRGLRQGMPISPLLSNVVLDQFDATMQNAGFTIVQYADDFIVLSSSESQCIRAHELAKECLRVVGHTISEIGEKKTQIASPEQDVEFLGLLIRRTPAGSYELFISDDQKTEILERLGRMTNLEYLESERINIANLMKKVRDIQIGYLGAYKNAERTNLQAFRDKLEATVTELPERVLRRIFSSTELSRLSPAARRFLCLG